VCEGQRYRLEKPSLLGTAVDLEARLSTVSSTEFYLIRENSVWPETSSAVCAAATEAAAADNDLICHHYRSYDVNIVHKLRPSIPAQLGVSSDKLELNPSSGSTTTASRFSRHSLIFSKPKSVTLSMDDIAACHLLDTQTTMLGRRTVQIIYSVDLHFKNYYLECDSHIAAQIVSHVFSILNSQTSVARQHFESQKQLKLTRRHTLRT
jgi:hypothetical protein